MVISLSYPRFCRAFLFMKFSKVTFRRKYNLGNFSNEEIDIEVDLDDADDVQEAINAARVEVDKNHVANNPQLYQSPVKEIMPWTEHPLQINHNNIEIKERPKQPPEPLTREQGIINQINEITDLKVLESFALIAKNNPKIKEVYDTKLQSLQKQTA